MSYKVQKVHVDQLEKVLNDPDTGNVVQILEAAGDHDEVVVVSAVRKADPAPVEVKADEEKKEEPDA